MPKDASPPAVIRDSVHTQRKLCHEGISCAEYETAPRPRVPHPQLSSETIKAAEGWRRRPDKGHELGWHGVLISARMCVLQAKGESLKKAIFKPLGSDEEPERGRCWPLTPKACPFWVDFCGLLMLQASRLCPHPAESDPPSLCLLSSVLGVCCRPAS